MAGPLSGIRAIEMSGIGPAPLAGMLLADLGVEILRIEPPFAREASVSIDREADVTLRGRRSIALDLKDESDRDFLLELCGKADLLIEGFRPGVMERLGLGPEEVAAVNPKLVYGRMTGWGQDGPMANRAGHDLNYIALSGALHPIGPADRVPTPPLNLVGDYGGGTMFLIYGLLAAYIEAQKSGQGQVVDAAIVDGAASLMSIFFAQKAADNWSDKREGNMIDGSAPWYRNYRTADDKFVSVGAIETKFYNRLIELMGLAGRELPDQFDKSRWPELEALFEQTFASKTRDAWCAILESEDTCFAPVLTLDEMEGHPHIQARQTVVSHRGIAQPAPAPRFSRTQCVLPKITGNDCWDCDDLLASWGVSRPVKKVENA